MITAQQMMSRLQSTHPGPPIERLGDSTFYLVRSRDLIAEVTARTEKFSSNLTATMVIDDHGTITEFPVAGLGSPSMPWLPPTGRPIGSTANTTFRH